MLDIDFFKRFNDTHGHLAGDAVLRKLGQVMKSTCRAYDDVGRYGGEEFCILLANTSLTDAVNYAERLRTTIAETVVTHADCRLSVTVSIGVAEHGPHCSDMAILIEHADHALYEAKRSGRNCVEAMIKPFGASEQTFARDAAMV